MAIFSYGGGDRSATMGDVRNRPSEQPNRVVTGPGEHPNEVTAPLVPVQPVRAEQPNSEGEHPAEITVPLAPVHAAPPEQVNRVVNARAEQPNSEGEHPNRVVNSEAEQVNARPEQPNSEGEQANGTGEQELGRVGRALVLLGAKADPRLTARGMVAERVKLLTWRYQYRDQWEAARARERWEQERRRKARELSARVESMKTVLAPLLRVEPHQVDLRVPVEFDEVAAAPDEDEDGEQADRQRDRMTVTLAIPSHFPHGQKDAVSEVVRDRLGGGEWVSAWHMDAYPHYVSFRRKVSRPKPPKQVEWKLSPDKYRVFVGQTGQRDMYVETETETPHWGVCAGTGSGKTTTLLLPAVHWRGHGAVVDVIDLKQESYDESIKGVSGFRVHTDVISAVTAMAEFLVSAKAVTTAKENGYPAHQIPPRVLLIDEFGSFVSAVENWWKYGLEKKGKPPVFAWFHMILMQGRTKEHRVVVGTHDFSASTFQGTSVRDEIGTKMLVGRISNPKWVTAFGYDQKKINVDAKIPGRSVIGIAGGSVEEMQVAYLQGDEAAAVCGDFEPAPGWFDAGELAPWVTEEAIEMTDREASVRPFLPGGEYVTYDDPIPESHEPQSDPVQVEQASTGLHVVRDAAAEQGSQLVGLREALDKDLLTPLVDEAAQRNPDARPDEVTRKALGVLRKASKVDPSFPASKKQRGNERLYLVRELWQWERTRPNRMASDDSGAGDAADSEGA